MTRVLLTGGTGFVGRQVARALATRGTPLRLVTRDPSRLPPDLAAQPLLDLRQTADLFAASPADLSALCAGVDTVIHAAWYAEPGLYLTAEANLDCLAGTLRLGQAAVAAGVRRFVGLGTCFEYALSADRLSTDAPLAPHTLYGAAKASAGLTLGRLMAQTGVSFAWARLFYLYGEGEDTRRLVPYIRARLAAGERAELSSGRQIRDFLDVAEAGRQIAALAASAHQGPANICSGQRTSVADLAHRIATEYGREDLLAFGARPDSPGDPAHVVGVPWQ